MGALKIDSIEWAAASRAAAEGVLGDGFAVIATARGALMAVVDGLGHGRPALESTALAIREVELHPDDDPAALCDRCHLALRGSRGAVMAVAAIDDRTGAMAWASVGNVAGLLMAPTSPPTVRWLLGQAGILGRSWSPFASESVTVRRDEILILATDGIGAHFEARIRPHSPAAAIAEDILAGAPPGDDALVVVARYRGVGR